MWSILNIAEYSNIAEYLIWIDNIIQAGSNLKILLTVIFHKYMVYVLKHGLVMKTFVLDANLSVVYFVIPQHESNHGYNYTEYVNLHQYT